MPEILASISHPHIITFYGATMNPPRVGIVMEFCEHGDLEVFISSFRERYGMNYPIKEKCRMLSEIVSAFDYIHSRSIIHRDLKLENVLVNSQMSCKLMDFGLSKIVDRMSQQKTKKIGTNIYMAPEICTGDGDYDEKCDVFSFGILVWVLVTENTMPYGKKTGMVELKVANNPDYRPDLEELEKCFGDDDEEDVERKEWMEKICKVSWNHDKEKRWSFSKLSDFLSDKIVVFTRSKFKKVLKTDAMDDGDVVNVNDKVLLGDCLSLIDLCKENGVKVPQGIMVRYVKTSEEKESSSDNESDM